MFGLKRSLAVPRFFNVLFSHKNLHATQNEAKHDGLEVTGSNNTTATLPQRAPLEMPACKDTHIHTGVRNEDRSRYSAAVALHV